VPRRRRATLIERSTPCQSCAFPLSQRHHLFGVAKYGENEITVQVCPNCHRLYHLIGECTRGNKESQKLLRPFMSGKLQECYFWPLFSLHRDVATIEDADQRRGELIERDREAIQRRIQDGELWDSISIEYWDKVGVQPESLHRAIEAVNRWSSGRAKGPLAAEAELRSQAQNELLDEWMADFSSRPDGEQAIEAAIAARMNEIKNRNIAAVEGTCHSSR